MLIDAKHKLSIERYRAPYRGVTSRYDFVNFYLGVTHDLKYGERQLGLDDNFKGLKQKEKENFDMLYVGGNNAPTTSLSSAGKYVHIADDVPVTKDLRNWTKENDIQVSYLGNPVNLFSYKLIHESSNILNNNMKEVSYKGVWAGEFYSIDALQEILQPDTEYTISYKFRLDETTFKGKAYNQPVHGTISLYSYNPEYPTIYLDEDYKNNVAKADMWKKGTVVTRKKTFRTPKDLYAADAKYKILLYTNRIVDDSNEFLGLNPGTFFDIKLEESTIPTDWSPSVYDNPDMAKQYASKKHYTLSSNGLKDPLSISIPISVNPGEIIFTRFKIKKIKGRCDAIYIGTDNINGTGEDLKKIDLTNETSSIYVDKRLYCTERQTIDFKIYLHKIPQKLEVTEITIEDLDIQYMTETDISTGSIEYNIKPSLENLEEKVSYMKKRKGGI